MKILIDAFNLIYKFPELELCMYEDRLDEAKEGLIQILHQVKSEEKEMDFFVFVDGKKTKGDYETYQEIREGIQIFYSQEQEADDLIRTFIKENDQPNRLLLVTSDKKILQFARQFKVKCYTSEVYSGMVHKILDGTPEEDENFKPDSSETTDLGSEWAKVFMSNQSQTK